MLLLKIIEDVGRSWLEDTIYTNGDSYRRTGGSRVSKLA